MLEKVNRHDSNSDRRSFFKKATVIGATLVGTAAGIFPELEIAHATPVKGTNDRLSAMNLRELQQAINKAQQTSEGRILEKFLLTKGYTFSLKGSTGFYATYKGETGYFLTLSYNLDDTHVASIRYAVHPNHLDAMFLGITTRLSATSLQVDAYQVIKGAIVHAETSTLRDSKFRVTNLSTGSVRNIDVSTTDQVIQPLATDSSLCGPCLTAFDFLFNFGCTITGSLACIACGVLTGPVGGACIILCGVFWYLYCYLGENVNKCYTCEYANLCTTC